MRTLESKLRSNLKISVKKAKGLAAKLDNPDSYTKAIALMILKYLGDGNDVVFADFTSI